MRNSQEVRGVERHPPEQLALLGRQRHNVVVEPRNLYPVVFVVQPADQSGDRRSRVRNRPAEDAGVQVEIRAMKEHGARDESSHTGDRARAVRPDHAGVRDDDDVAVESIPALREQIREVRRPGLLFTLDEQLQVHGWARAPGGGQMGPQAQQMEQQLPFVVGRAPGTWDVAVDGWVEWV